MIDNNNSLLKKKKKIFSECTKGKTKPINERFHFFSYVI